MCMLMVGEERETEGKVEQDRESRKRERMNDVLGYYGSNDLFPDYISNTFYIFR